MLYLLFILSSLTRFAMIALRIFTGLFVAFDSTALAILGWLFVPFTTLAYLLIVHANGGLGEYWPIMIITVILDFVVGMAPIVDENCDTMGVFKH